MMTTNKYNQGTIYHIFGAVNRILKWTESEFQNYSKLIHENNEKQNVKTEDTARRLKMGEIKILKCMEGETHKGMCLSLWVSLHPKLLTKKHKLKNNQKTITCAGNAKIYM